MNRQIVGAVRRIGLVGFCTCMLLAPAGANESMEYFIQHALDLYFDLPSDARHTGLAGSRLATSDGVDGLFANPAGLGWLRDVSLQATYLYDRQGGEEFIIPAGTPDFNSVHENIHNLHAQLGVPLKGGEWGVVGVGISGWSSDVNDQLNTETDGWRLTLGVAKAFNESISAGYTLTLIDGKHDNDWDRSDTDDGLRHALGLQWRPDPAWLVGVHGFYATGDQESEIKLLGPYSGDRSSWGVGIGAAWRVNDKTTLSAGADYTDYDLDAHIFFPAGGLNENIDESGEVLALCVGVEHRFSEAISGRAGVAYHAIDYEFNDSRVVEHLSGDADHVALALGLGWQASETVRVDYGFGLRFVGDTDMTHALTLAIAF